MVHGGGGESQECLLLVEGPDDKAIAIHFRIVVESLPEFHVDDRGSVHQVLEAIQPEVLVSGRKALGIVVDANESSRRRWQAVSDRLSGVGVRAPKQPDRDGTIIEESSRLPRVGIWIMPDNESIGELEDFLITMLPEGDPVWPRSVAYIDGIPQQDRMFKEKKVHRAQLHAWLAAREEPRPSGRALRAGDLRVDAILAGKFVEWLRRLFGYVDEPGGVQ